MELLKLEKYIGLHMVLGHLATSKCRLKKLRAKGCAMYLINDTQGLYYVLCRLVLRTLRWGAAPV